VPSAWVELVHGLAEHGALSPWWRAAFLAAPREVFIPEAPPPCSPTSLAPGM
jgi:hypothetical protein